jgi:hypothetical protein
MTEFIQPDLNSKLYGFARPTRAVAGLSTQDKLWVFQMRNNISGVPTYDYTFSRMLSDDQIKLVCTYRTTKVLQAGETTQPLVCMTPAKSTLNTSMIMTELVPQQPQVPLLGRLLVRNPRDSLPVDIQAIKPQIKFSNVFGFLYNKQLSTPFNTSPQPPPQQVACVPENHPLTPNVMLTLVKNYFKSRSGWNVYNILGANKDIYKDFTRTQKVYNVTFLRDSPTGRGKINENIKIYFAFVTQPCGWKIIRSGGTSSGYE